MEEIQEHRERSMTESVTIRIDAKENYRCNQSFLRGAENQELDNRLENSVINYVHRWLEFEGSKGKQPGLNMLEHYAAGANTCYLQMIFVKIL